MIIKNSLGLEVSVDDKEVDYIVSRYKNKLDDVNTLSDFSKNAKDFALKAVATGLIAAGLSYAVAKYADNLKEEAVKDILRDFHSDERTVDFWNEVMHGGK